MTMPDWTPLPRRWIAILRVLAVALPIMTAVIGSGYFIVSKSYEAVSFVTDVVGDLKTIHAAIRELDRLGVGRDAEIAAVKADVASHDQELRETHEAVNRVETLATQTNNNLTALMTQLLGKSRSATTGR